jgi:hypothetical protein
MDHFSFSAGTLGSALPLAPGSFLTREAECQQLAMGEFTPQHNADGFSIYSCASLCASLFVDVSLPNEAPSLVKEESTDTDFPVTSEQSDEFSTEAFSITSPSTIGIPSPPSVGSSTVGSSEFNTRAWFVQATQKQRFRSEQTRPEDLDDWTLAMPMALSEPLRRQSMPEPRRSAPIAIEMNPNVAAQRRRSEPVMYRRSPPTKLHLVPLEEALLEVPENDFDCLFEFEM